MSLTYAPRMKEQNYKLDAVETIPPGKKKIIDALKALLEKKEFDTITTAEIAQTAGVSEALIYKYFKDKRDLLYVVLRDYLDEYLARFESDLKGIEGHLNRIRRLIWMHIHVYASNRVMAKILSLVVRGLPDFYASETYDWIVTVYARRVLNVIEEGIRSGEIRSDVPPKFIRQVLLGSLEHICLREVIFDKEIDPDELTENLCKLLFRGIENRDNPQAT
ncbi:MAG: TetR/AcrR family transcriptional regulator [Syntrophales bacterium]|nr:TetR/AcrR family transcriptional regulator [Syntrophales bacterium]MDD5533430.1 TetR/AcrR family transcriptional regulator [Syntrophales bacterium]